MRANVLRGAATVVVAAAALVAVIDGAEARPDRLLADPRIDVTSYGERPQVLVDQIGTAHIVWNAPGRPTGPDVLHYCRIPRGGTSCVGTTTFVPPESPADFNRDAGTRIVQTSPDEIVVLTHRYPPVVISEVPSGKVNPRCYEENPGHPERCYGSSNNSTWAYVTHGGEFEPPKLLGTGRLSGVPVVLTEGFDAPRIAMVSDTETGGTYFQAVRPDGYSNVLANLGEDTPLPGGLSGSVATIGGAVPVVAWANLSYTTFVRVYRGGPMNERTSWRPAVAALEKASAPRLVGGPRGFFMLYRDERGFPSRYYVTRIEPSGRAVGRGEVVSPDESDVADRDFFQDSGGNLHAAWVNRTGGFRVQYRFAARPGDFGELQTLARSSDAITNVDVSAAEDGGGFAVWEQRSGDHSLIQAVPFGPQTPLIDVRVTGIEVTQAVQSFDLPKRDLRRPKAPVPYTGALLSDRVATIVRVYANSRGPLGGTGPPVVSLRAFRGGRELGLASIVPPPLLPEFSPASLDVGGPSDVPLDKRRDARGAYTFTLPWAWLSRNTTLVAEINPLGLKPSIAECARCRSDNMFTLTAVSYRKTTDVHILPIAMMVNGKWPQGFPIPDEPFAGLVATSPMHIDVQNYRAGYDVSDIENNPDLDRHEKGLEAFDRVAAWADYGAPSSSTYPIGVLPDGTNIGGLTNSGGELYSSTQPISVAGAGRLLTSVAHEVGHGIGRRHAGQNCPGTAAGDDQEGEPWPTPGNDGALDGIGLDRRQASPYRIVASGVPDGPKTIYDLMSYCPPGGGANESLHWTSLRNWNRAVEFRAPPQGLVTDRKVAGATATASLRVSAVVFGSQGRVLRVTPDAGRILPVPERAPFTLVSRSAAGAVLARAGVKIESSTEGSGLLLVGRVPAAGAATVSVERTDGTAAVAERRRSVAAPRVSIVTPSRVGARPLVPVRWVARDADGGRLLATVEYSSNGGRSWRTISLGPSRGTVALPRRLFTVSRRARVRVRVSDGFNETIAVSKAFRSLGAPPEARILSPRPGARVAAGSALVLEGVSFDDAGRRLRAGRLRWLDGRVVLGRGERLTAPALTPGLRRIALEATDGRGRRSRTTVAVRVTATKPLFRVLQAPARVSRRARRVTIRVAVTVSATLAVGGRRFPVGLRACALVVPVRPGRSPLRLALRLVSGGKVTTVTLTILRR